MRKLLCSSFLLIIFVVDTHAQVRIYSPQRTAERSVENRVNSRINQGIDRGIDKVEEGVIGIFKKKDKKPDTPNANGNNPAQADNGNTSQPPSDNPGNAPGQQPTRPTALRTYSKFDFVPGNRVTALDDFTQDEIGDFPARWNTNGSGEIVTIEGEPGRWLQLNDATLAFPEFVNNLPDNFTLEFTVAANPDPAMQYNLHFLNLLFTPETDPKDLFAHRSNFIGEGNLIVSFSPHALGLSKLEVWEMGSRNVLLHNEVPMPTFSFKNNKPVARVSVWRQKNRLRLYVDDEKIWDIPRAFSPEATYRRLAFQVASFGKGPYFVSGLRLAVGAPDTRNKLLTEGRFVTTGIGFDTGSDRIRPESFGILKQIAGILQENPDLRVRIIGHTDSDGDEARNLDLSKRRAASVRAALTSSFGVADDRLEADGRGETELATPNTSAEGKANNRRVEFLKL